MEIAHGVVNIGSVSLSFAQVGIVLVVFVVIGVLGEEVARYKGHSPVLWLILCSLMPLLLLAALTLKSKPRKADLLAAQAAAAAAAKRSAKSRRSTLDDEEEEEPEEPPAKTKAKGLRARR